MPSPDKSARISGSTRHERREGRFWAGQTILEATVACGIVATAIASALTVTQAALNAEKQSESGIVAANLAREGVEVVRGMRDSNWLKDLPWDEGLTGADNDHTAIAIFDPASGRWSLDFQANDVAESVARFYRYVTGDNIGLMVQALDQPPFTTPLLFSRLLIIDPICDDGSIKESGYSCDIPPVGYRVTSRVRWLSVGRFRTFDVIERLYDWR
ncbi:MAG: hypothetical protein PHT12_03370 [Patescibacteria group bacterium]|nr:hypothetical protein [Patescibacteria group bacterium]